MKDFPTLSPLALRQALTEPEAPVVFDVRLAADFADGHVPGAVNAEVYTVGFLDAVKAAASPGTALVVYGHAQDQSAPFAAYKLGKAGFRKVTLLTGGVDAWTDAGGEVEGTAPEAATVPSLPSGEVSLDLSASSLGWSGHNIGSQHTGTMAFSCGEIVFSEDGKPTSLHLVVDMTSIAVTDIPDEKLAGVLKAHLENEDFFEVDRYPESVFQSTRIEVEADALPMAPNLTVTGNLTLKDQTHEITFKASLGRNFHGQPVLRAALDLDRTRWGVLYGSPKFFARLANHLVADEIHLDILLVASAD